MISIGQLVSLKSLKNILKRYYHIFDYMIFKNLMFLLLFSCVEDIDQRERWQLWHPMTRNRSQSGVWAWHTPPTNWGGTHTRQSNKHAACTLKQIERENRNGKRVNRGNFLHCHLLFEQHLHWWFTTTGISFSKFIACICMYMLLFRLLLHFMHREAWNSSRTATWNLTA